MLNATNGDVLFTDQTVDLNSEFDLGLGKAHHASMNGGSIISQGMVYVPYGAQNNPSGGLIAYELNYKPYARRDVVKINNNEPTIINALANDGDSNGDALRFARVAGTDINVDDGSPDVVTTGFGSIEVFNPGDDLSHPHAAYLKFTPGAKFKRLEKFAYQVVDIAPKRKVNGIELSEPEPTHTPRRARAHVWLLDRRAYLSENLYQQGKE